jgi:hypothetical protein
LVYFNLHTRHTARHPLTLRRAMCGARTRPRPTRRHVPFAHTHTSRVSHPAPQRAPAHSHVLRTVYHQCCWCCSRVSLHLHLLNQALLSLVPPFPSTFTLLPPPPSSAATATAATVSLLLRPSSPPSSLLPPPSSSFLLCSHPQRHELSSQATARALSSHLSRPSRSDRRPARLDRSPTLSKYAAVCRRGRRPPHHR